VMYDQLALTKVDSVRTQIQMEINRLNIEASKYAIPNEFDALSGICGSSELNAYTSQDVTVYHSDFIPQFFEQWAEINSERIMNPVFRLFQSELETVYEEKNMYADDPLRSAYELMEEHFYEGTPYSAPVVGYTESLKNPQLSQMKAFFEKYYVASNMGLAISGDFKTEEVLPIIEKTFGRIRKGEIKQALEIKPREFQGRTEETIPINIPLIKAGAVCYNAPAIGAEDYDELSLVSLLLNNNEGTGLLDKLTADGKVMLASAPYPMMSYNQIGVLPVVVIPKLVGQSYAKAEKLVFNEIEKIKQGDIPDDLLESCKLSYRKSQMFELEDQNNRVFLMVNSIAKGKTWERTLADLNALDGITKEDVVRVANKYINGNCLAFKKKTGEMDKDNMKKPPYEKVVPQCKDSVSVYARNLRESTKKVDLQMPILDFDTALTKKQLAPLVRLYASSNPVNDIFHLKIRFLRGKIAEPGLDRLVSYLSILGTEDKSYDQFNGELQKLGGSISYSVDGSWFDVYISGFDENFEQTLALASTIFKNVKADKKKLSTIKSDEKAGLTIQRKSLDELASALYSKTVYGDKSVYCINKGPFKSEYLLGLWSDIQKVQCDVLYTGTLSADNVGETVSKYLDVNSVTEASDAPVEREKIKSKGPEVLFINKPDASQTLIYAYVPSDKMIDREVRDMSFYYANYLGSGMTSLMFQEIREFRSMAYSTGSGLYKTQWKNRENYDTHLIAFVGTQNDKAIDAMEVVDSLIGKLPILPEKMETKRVECINQLYNIYPSFRGLPEYIEEDNLNGWTYDNTSERVDFISTVTPEMLSEFSDAYFAGRPVIWCVVGNAKKIDMEGLAKFGPVTRLKVKEVIK